MEQDHLKVFLSKLLNDENENLIINELYKSDNYEKVIANLIKRFEKIEEES